MDTLVVLGWATSARVKRIHISALQARFRPKNAARRSGVMKEGGRERAVAREAARVEVREVVVLKKKKKDGVSFAWMIESRGERERGEPTVLRIHR
jgi:hypothetical protein